MANYLDYQFGATAATIDGVREELRRFHGTLNTFTDSYKQLARCWGGDASRNAELRATDIELLGTETAGIVNKFIQEYEDHFFLAKTTENQIADRFGGSGTRAA